MASRGPRTQIICYLCSDKNSSVVFSLKDGDNQAWITPLIKNLTGVSSSQIDNSRFICQTCVKKLNGFNDFKKRLMNSLSTLESTSSSASKANSKETKIGCFICQSENSKVISLNSQFAINRVSEKNIIKQNQKGQFRPEHQICSSCEGKVLGYQAFQIIVKNALTGQREKVTVKRPPPQMYMYTTLQKPQVQKQQQQDQEPQQQQQQKQQQQKVSIFSHNFEQKLQSHNFGTFYHILKTFCQSAYLRHLSFISSPFQNLFSLIVKVKISVTFDFASQLLEIVPLELAIVFDNYSSLSKIANYYNCCP